MSEQTATSLGTNPELEAPTPTEPQANRCSFEPCRWPGFTKRIGRKKTDDHLVCLRFEIFLYCLVLLWLIAFAVFVWGLFHEVYMGTGLVGCVAGSFLFFAVCKWERALTPALYVAVMGHLCFLWITIIRNGGVAEAMHAWAALSLAMGYPFLCPRPAVGVLAVVCSIVPFVAVPLYEHHVEDIPRVNHASFPFQIGFGLVQTLITAIIFWRMTFSLVELGKLMQQARDEAVQAKTIQERFLAKMSHEVRTPLSGLMGLIDLAEEEEEDMPSICEKLRHMKRLSVLLKSVIDDVLNLAKLSSGQERLILKPLTTNSFFTDCLGVYTGLVRQKGIALSVSVASDVPTSVLADEFRLQQMLNNYTDNAIKFTDEGSVTVNITVENHDHHTIRVEVQDTGIGLTEQQRQKLFRPFSQANENINRRYGGTGLGLSIVLELATLMGGSAGVMARAGGGSIFWFTFKAQESQVLESVECEETIQRWDTQCTPCEQTRVVVVDDNEVNRIVAREMLKRIGAVPVCFSSGFEAVEYLRDNRTAVFDMVLTDIWMPHMDGLETAKAMLEVRPGLNIVGLTADVTQETERLALEAGMSNVLWKPLKKAKLIDLCHTAKKERQSPDIV